MNFHISKKKSNSNHFLKRSAKNESKNTPHDKNFMIMNKLFYNNPELLKNFRKKHSKTPSKMRIKEQFSSPINANYMGLKKINSKDAKTLNINNANNNRRKRLNINNNKSSGKKNNSEIKSSPLTKYINLQEENAFKKKYMQEMNQFQNLFQCKNKLSRSESFSILESNHKKGNIINNANNEDKENNQNHNNNNSTSNNNLSSKSIDNSSKNINKSNSTNRKVKNKICKKIYKIESLCQVGYSGPGVLKYNQDNFFIYKNLNDENGVLFIGVCDGHGLFGHDVSKYLINHLPQNLNRALKKTNKYIHHKETLYKTIKEVFINTNKDLCKNPLVDTQFSGSTCVTIILTKNKIISGNAGDSRAVMGRCKNGVWTNIDLSHDQKPNNPGERERILSHGGRIEAYKDENGNDFGPKRVWIKNEDIPGLAMSRSFGDEVAASVGTISEPEIETFEITADDKFIIIASDGIWEFISSQECVNIIKDFYLKKDLKGCLKHLLNESSKRWIKEEEVIDDITAVLIFFEE